ncbi:MAG: 50S ribosome-binding GTPase, partial [Firmicutes bacterium]|nr:ferrous iron transporter B [Alicyclobacillaceae bacterium]MCL6497357.1 50S ribosome-binding GTPase [Bacillota bacterium]
MPVVLVGNPNVGKSVLFRALTGHYQEVSNFPGTTVEIRRGRTDGQEVWDTPGVFGLARFTPEEQVTVQALTEAELVVNVVDASRLGRDLFLTLQLVALGVPLVVVLNRLDAVRQRGDFLDAEVLARRLGVPVVRAVGIRGEGVPELRQWIAEPPAPPPAPRFWSELPARARRLPPVERLLWWEEDPQAVAAVGAAPPPGNREEEYARRREAADQLAAACYRARDPERGAQWDRWLLHPVWGMAVLVAVLAAAYLFVGVAVSNRLVGRLEAWGGQHWDPWVRARVLTILPADSVVARMLVGEWGILTATVTYLLALLLPLIGAFELLLACLEDTGYLPRLAVLLDRWFLRLGLNGRAVIPLLLGFGCVTMAMISTRVLETRRERAIATILLSWTIPCSAQVGVITGLLSGLGPGWAMAYVGIVAGVFVTVGTLLDRTLSGRPTPLLLDLPPLAWPRPTELWHKWRHRVANF